MFFLSIGKEIDMIIVQTLENTEEMDSVRLQRITLEKVDGVPMSVH